MARERRKPTASDRKRIPKKKTSILTTENIKYVDYKDVNLLRRFMSERAKVRARRVTGNSQQQQVAVARAIRIAREMALLPYSLRQVTQRSKGGPRGRDRGDRGERGDRGMPPMESIPTREAVAVPAEAPVAVETVDVATETVDVATEMVETASETMAAVPGDGGTGDEAGA